MNIVRIVLADDHPIVLEGLTALLNEADGLRVVGKATDLDATLALIASLSPEVVVLDISMPGGDSLQLVRLCAGRYPALKFLILTVHEERQLVERLLRAGASGYLLKRSAAEDLVHAIRAIVAGGTYIDPAIAGKLVGAEPIAATPLSRREQTVLEMVALGLSCKETAGRLALSPKTVATYRARAVEKIGARSRADIVRYGLAQGWLGSGRA